MEDNVLDQLVLMGDDTARILDGLFRLVDDGVRCLGRIRDDDGLLHINGYCAGYHCQGGDEKGCQLHGRWLIRLLL